MTTTALRLPLTPPVPSPPAFFQSGLGIAAGWTSVTVSASYYNGKTYVGFVDGDGKIRVASYNHTTRTWTLSPGIVTIAADVHCAPSVLVRSSDHKILVAATPHDTAHLYVAVSTNAEDVSAWGVATDIAATLGGASYTYANLFQLSGETGKIYLFYRDNQDTQTSGALAYSTSTDGGSTWAAQTTLYKNTGKQCYWAIGSDSTSRLDFVVTDGDSLNHSDAASLYHFYYDGSFRKSDGSVLGSAPYAPANLTKIYDQANGYVRAPSAVLTASGLVTIVWATLDPAGTGSNMHYWYGHYSGGSWTTHEITNTGSVPDPAEGGISLDPTDATRVFLSKKTSTIWQMFKYETGDGGTTWTSTQLTSDTATIPDDVRQVFPVAPRDATAAFRVGWLFGPNAINNAAAVFLPSQQIRGYPNPIQPF